MVVGLVPYRWVTDSGMPHWALPVGVTSSIDLRRIDQITNTAATGYAIATYPTSLPAGAVTLSSGSVAVRRSAWQSTLGYLPQGSTPEEWVFDHLLNGTDDTFAASCRPLRCIGPDRVEMHLGGQRFERLLNGSERLQQAVFVRRDLNAIFDDVEAGRLPAGMHRKALKAMADRLGIDWQTLRPNAARWQRETPLEPTTQITDDGWSGSSQSIASYGWTVWGNAAHTWTTGSGVFLFTGSSASASGLIAFHPTALSASDMLATAETVAAGDYCGPFARGFGSTNSNWSGYGCDNYAGEATLQVFSFVSSSPTLLGQDSSGSAPYTQRVQAIGSTIKASDNGSAWRLTYTNTAVTSGLRAGLWGWGGPYSNVTVNTFTADDFLSSSGSLNSQSLHNQYKRGMLWPTDGM